jgi:hypothetical protein
MCYRPESAEHQRGADMKFRTLLLAGLIVAGLWPAPAT